MPKIQHNKRMNMGKKVFVIEYAKGSDKGFDGFRADTKPILNAIAKETGYGTEIVFYRPNKSMTF
jgi:hypothetical protein